jgi:hypothetical protein
LDQQSLVGTTGEYGGWFPQATTYQYDTDAVQSSQVQHSEQTALALAVTGPTPLSFYWKVSSESGYDLLRFYIDSVLQNTISGTVDWTQVNHALGAGAHLLTWIYSKDASVSSGSDCGWVDHVGVSPAGTYTLSLTKGGTGGGKAKVGGDPIPHDLPYAEAFASGSQVGIEAVPDSGSAFTDWSGDLVSPANPAIVTLDQNKSITANFESTLTPTITVTSPNGGESWALGSTHAVNWTQTALTGQVTIDLYRGGSYLKNLGTAEAVAGTFSWAISPSETAGTNYRIVIWQGSVTDTSDANFSLQAPTFLLQESFTAPSIPAGWAYQNVGNTAAWTVSATTFAGGSANEMLRHWSAGTLSRLVTPPINTTGISSVQLSFRHFYDAFSTGMTLKVQTSPDATTWTDEAWVVAAGTTNIGPETVITTLAHNLNISTTYVGFVVTGTTLAYMDNWYIDNVEIAGSAAPSTCKVDFNGDGQEDILWRNHGAGAYQGLNVVWLMSQYGALSAGTLENGLAKAHGTSLLTGATANVVYQTRVGAEAQRVSAPKRAFATVVKGGKIPSLKPKQIMRHPMDIGRAFPASKPERVRDRDLRLRTVPTRKDAMNPGTLNSGTAEIASIGIGSEIVFSSIPDTAWEIAGTGDFNGDTKTDILWRYYGTGPYQGLNDVWYMNGTTFLSESVFSQIPDTNWRIAGTGDFNGDQKTDILWRYYGTGPYEGLNDIWFMDGTTFLGESVFSQVSDTNWRIAGIGDFNGDTKTDILWRYYGTGPYQGLNDIWFMDGTSFLGEAVFSQVLDTAWEIGGIGDFNGDQKTDILWRYYGTGPYQGLNDIWYMNGVLFLSEEVFSSVPDTSWRIVNH